MHLLLVAVLLVKAALGVDTCKLTFRCIDGVYLPLEQHVVCL